ncbi:MAG: dihydroorotase [Alphaproteobacteria bacterium]
MSENYDLLVRGGTCLTPSGRMAADVGVRGGRIAGIGDLSGAEGAQIFDATGLHVLPGVIDTQVHFREPGLDHKEDLGTGTAGAVAGGVAAIFEMPNTSPGTVDGPALADKLSRAAAKAWCDHAFFIGATADNAAALGQLERLPGCCGVKIFMGSSTGDLLVADDAGLAAALGNGVRRVAIHAEDEARLKERFALVADGAPVDKHPVWRDVETALRATQRLLAIARQTGRRVHVLHITTGVEMALLAQNRDIASVEVTPQHLTLSADDCYEKLGTLAQMNPPIRDSGEQAALWQAIREGVVDVIGSDHAPHTRGEKERAYPRSPAGMPGVQTLVPLMLDHVAAGRLTLERFVDLTAHGPGRIYNIAGKGRLAKGYDGDLTIVDLKARRTIGNDWIRSKCGWTPFDGRRVMGWPIATIIRGRIVMRDDELLGEPSGKPVRFQETLAAL